MSEEMKVETAMEENFAELLEQSLKTLNNGDKVTGTVMAIGTNEVEVDLGTKHTAYIPVEEFTSADPSAKIEDLVIELKKQYTIVMVTHNMQQAVRVSDKTVFFLLGEVIEAGETEKLFSIPQDKRTEDYITGRFG